MEHEEMERQAAGLVAGNPASAMLIAFGVGLATGVLVVNVLFPATRPRPYGTEMIGRLSDAVIRAMPESIMTRLQR